MFKRLTARYGILITTIIGSVACIVASMGIAGTIWSLVGLPDLGALLVVAFICPAIIAPIVISSLCRLNENIRENEEFMELVFDAIQDGVSVLDKNLNVVRVNKTLRELYSHMLPFEGKYKCYEVYHGRSEPCEICPTLRALKSGKLEVAEVPLVTKDGVTGTLEIFVFPMFDKEGSVNGVVEYVRNITKHVEAIKALADSEKRYKTLFESANDAIFIKDMNGKILDANNIAYESLGYDKKDLIGMNISQVDHPDFARKIPEQIKTLQEQGKIIFESVYRRKDGSTMPVEVSATVINLGENDVILSVVRDISLRKKLGKEILKVKKLETTGVLAGGIAHDFNNILTAILGNINLALSDTKLSEETKRRLIDSEKASLRATGLTQQLLTFAKGGAPVKKTSSLGKIVTDSASFVLRGDKVSCIYDIHSDLWPVEIDEGQISQVIQNIVINASHAMPEGGNITITCENVNSVSREGLPSIRDGRYVKISIHDNGLGMSPNVLEKIFDPYFTTKHRGSGLGLAISQSIIQKHDGYIMAESNLDLGSTFTIYLPASEKKVQAETNLPEEIKKLPKAKILLMDDDEMVRDTGREMLVKLGHEVVLSEDGRQAIDLYRESFMENNKFDLVIMDLTVPGGVGGEDAVRGILSIDPNAKVIVSSGYSNNRIMANYKHYGFCSAITKPYRIQKLSEIIHPFIS
ncbi:MAG: PAS domain S-box protein [Deltaproteobacteria bacterium]